MPNLLVFSALCLGFEGLGKAHPFYKWLQREHGFKPRWTFYKVLLDANGDYVDSYSSMTKPMSGKLTRKIETLLR